MLSSKFAEALTEPEENGALFCLAFIKEKGQLGGWGG
jgi:hypothetical protein